MPSVNVDLALQLILVQAQKKVTEGSEKFDQGHQQVAEYCVPQEHVVNNWQGFSMVQSQR